MEILKWVSVSLLSCFVLNVFAETLPPLKPGVLAANQRAGDIIAPFTDSQVAAWCDFTKQIVITPGHILCAYNGSKAAPATSESSTFSD